MGGRSGEPDREQREGHADDVGEHVAGIGEEREAVGHRCADHLDDQDREAQSEDRHQPPAVCPCGRAVAVRHQTHPVGCVGAPGGS